MKRELDIHLGLAEEILRLLEHEKKLLRGTKRSDAERYKHIQYKEIFGREFEL